MDTQDIIFVPLVLLLALGAQAAVVKLHSTAEARVLNWSLTLHLTSTLAQVLLTRYYFAGGGDMLGYYLNGVAGAELLRGDLPRFGPAIARAFFQLPGVDPIVETLFISAGTTQSMGAVSMVLCFLLGNSIYACSLVVAVAAYLSKVLLFRALRGAFAPHLAVPVLCGLTLLPSAAFWSSAMLKEPLVMCLLGPCVLGLHWLAAGRRYVAATLLLVPSAAGMAVLKPYILMALALAAGVYYLWSRLLAKGPVTLKPFALITAVAIATAGLTLGSRYFGKGEGQSVGAALAGQRRVGYDIEGGSGYQLDAPSGSASDVSKRTIAQELALAPVALVTALFRPFLFEARNAVQLANAIEATVLLWLAGLVLTRVGARGVLAALLASPTLLFSSVFVFAVALGTGLASSNLGTLSRYRAPMMPFFFMMLLVFRAHAAGRAGARREGVPSMLGHGQVVSAGREPAT